MLHTRFTNSQDHTTNHTTHRPLDMVESTLDHSYNVTSHPGYSSKSEYHPNLQPQSLCYFTYTPSHSSDHWSVETPIPSPAPSPGVVADPHNPLLAVRVPHYLLTPPQTMDASRLLQLQTAAAHQAPQRPKPQPHQDVLDVSDDSMPGSSSSSNSLSSLPHVCSRCQTSFGQFVAFALNSYYCTRCAKIVGYGG